LRGFAGAGGRGQNQPAIGLQARDDFRFDFINGQTIVHERTQRNNWWWTGEINSTSIANGSMASFAGKQCFNSYRGFI
jgi:hypothetical protein